MSSFSSFALDKFASGHFKPQVCLLLQPAILAAK